MRLECLGAIRQPSSETKVLQAPITADNRITTMSPLFALSYLLPAGVLLLAFWAIWRIIRLFDFSLGVRRTLFVLMGTLAFAPMVAPAATILSTWVPHGLLLIMPELGYYLRFAHIVFPSFVITAGVFAVVAWWLIRANTPPLKPNWATIVIPIIVATLVISLYRFVVPDSDIPADLTTDAIESAYGDQLDAVVSLLAFQDSERKERETERLRRVFDADDAVVRVYLQAPSAVGDTSDNAFSYLKGRSPPSTSCSGSYRLMRCIWSYDTFDQKKTLRYRRIFEFAEEALAVEIEFDYENLDALEN